MLLKPVSVVAFKMTVVMVVLSKGKPGEGCECSCASQGR
jgi:hypothetical protein